MAQATSGPVAPVAPGRVPRAAPPYAGVVPQLIAVPTRVPVPGGKVIEEFAGRASTGDAAVSVARMAAPPGWEEPAQTPEFDEVTLVLRGSVVVEHAGGSAEVRAGQALLTRAGERVRYVAGPDGAEYVAVCVPAFGPDLVHREAPADGEGPDAGPAGNTAGA